MIAKGLKNMVPLNLARLSFIPVERNVPLCLLYNDRTAVTTNQYRGQTAETRKGVTATFTMALRTFQLDERC